MSSPESSRAIWHVDRPVRRPAADRFLLQGWVAANGPVERIEPVTGEFVSFAWLDRPDLVPPPNGARWARGFQALATREVVQTGILRCRVAGGGPELAWTFGEAVDAARKARKLAAVRSQLTRVEPVRATPDFLSYLPAGTLLEEPERTSGFNYPPVVDALIARHPNGWILDCGAGDRPAYFDNVVNLEIAAYPSTDVAADAENLPFRDACFDGIVTLAVLEHVPRPWLVARELMRVLKPGGTLIADVPFLQPVHAYPNHYYNMTSEGLQSLFREWGEIVSAEVPHYGRPIYTLSWFLQRYADGLPPEVRERFLRMSVSDLLAPADRQAAADYVAALPPAVNTELASVTSIVVRKR